jgi:AraC family ethanolamine operon transcriptional activator
MEFRVRATSDVHDHSFAVNGWEQVYNQLTPGRFESVVMQVQAPDFLFFRESTNRRVAQAGVAPRGLSSLALPLQSPVSGTFQGCRLDGYALWLLESGEEFRFYTPETMHYLGVSIPTSDLHALAAAVLGATWCQCRPMRANGLAPNFPVSSTHSSASPLLSGIPQRASGFATKS